MATFLNTTGISYHLEKLIEETKDQLVLISPYLQFHHRVKDHIDNLYVKKCDIRIVYRENKLQIDESQWLEDHVGIRTSILSSLHAKCYFNENKAIVTSMNLYSFSQQNNDEMGILVTKEEDPKLYEKISSEVKRLLTVSKEIRVSIKKIDNDISGSKEKNIKPKFKRGTENLNAKLKSTSALSKTMGIPSKELFEIFERKGWIKKNGKSWLLTPKGELQGGQTKNGQYGEYVAWPEEILEKI